MLKLLSAMLCPVCWMCTWMGEGFFRCSLCYPPGFWLSLLCIVHCMLCCCIGSCRWHHFSCLWGSVLRPHEYFLMVVIPLNVPWCHTLNRCIWNFWLGQECMEWLLVLLCWRVLGFYWLRLHLDCCWLVVIVVCAVLIIALFLLVAVENFILNLVDGPGGVLALAHCIPEVSKFLLEELWVSANCFSPVDECTYDTVLGRKTMMTIPLQVLVSVGGFVIHCYG